MTISVMLTATQARAKAQNDIIIFNEVRNIEFAVLTAIANGQYQIEVIGTTMTDTTNNTTLAISREYFKVWQGITSSRSKDAQMGAVIQYFTDLGYTIDRKTNSLTGDTFMWQVLW